MLPTCKVLCTLSLLRTTLIQVECESDLCVSGLLHYLIGALIPPHLDHILFLRQTWIGPSNRDLIAAIAIAASSPAHPQPDRPRQTPTVRISYHGIVDGPFPCLEDIISRRPCSRMRRTFPETSRDQPSNSLDLPGPTTQPVGSERDRANWSQGAGGGQPESSHATTTLCPFGSSA